MRALAWAIEDEPALLTGGGARAPIPGVLRLIDELCGAGAQALTRPACPRCQRVMHLYRRIGGQWCCRACVASARAQPCARCGAVREAATRDEHGRPLCPTCLITDPANQETCAKCGRRRPVSTRTADGPVCPACRPWKMLTCSICGEHAPCLISKTTGTPWCRACKQRWARCTRCGSTARVRGGTRAEPLCAACTRPEPGFWRTCPGCGQTGRIHTGRCGRCTVQLRLREVLSDETGTIRPGLQALYQALTACAGRKLGYRFWPGLSCGGPVLVEQSAQTLSASDPVDPGRERDHVRFVFGGTQKHSVALVAAPGVVMGDVDVEHVA